MQWDGDYETRNWDVFSLCELEKKRVHQSTGWILLTRPAMNDDGRFLAFETAMSDVPAGHIRTSLKIPYQYRYYYTEYRIRNYFLKN
jgi:hypothetical protein